MLSLGGGIGGSAGKRLFEVIGGGIKSSMFSLGLSDIQSTLFGGLDEWELPKGYG